MWLSSSKERSLTDRPSRMIKTGDWNVGELVGYLVDVQGTLSEVEVGKLGETKIFMVEVAATPVAGGGGP